MSRSNQSDFDGYHKWLGIPKSKSRSYYDILALSLDEEDHDVIRAAVEQRRHFVESKLGEGQDDVVAEILYQINEAEVTLLNEELRREYDRRMALFERRRKNRQVDPIAASTRFKSRPGRVIGEDNGFMATFTGLVGVICVAFAIMAWFSFKLPWQKQEQQPDQTSVAEMPMPAPSSMPPVSEPRSVPVAGTQPSVEAPPMTNDEPPPVKVKQSDPEKSHKVDVIAAKPPSEDRRVADWVMQVGGRLTVSLPNGQTTEIRGRAALPDQQFDVLHIDLREIGQIRNDDLRRLSPLQHLKVLTLMNTLVTDDALRHLAGLNSLEELNVAATPINGSGFSHIAGLENLSTLLCGGCQAITNDSLIHLKSLKRLTVLGLIDTTITDAALQDVAQIRTLKELRLSGSGFQLKITDKGLGYLHGMKQLEKLSVRKTRVTSKGVSAFQRAVPKCKVDSDFGR